MNIHHQLAIAATPEKVFETISESTNIGKWWDEQTEKETEQGLVLEHNPGNEHGVVQLLVLEKKLNQRIEWKCISSHAASSPASVWTGTHFIFEISKQETPASKVVRSCPGFEAKNLCTLDFYQTNYDENSKFSGFNNFAWAQVLQGLKEVCEGNANES